MKRSLRSITVGVAVGLLLSTLACGGRYPDTLYAPFARVRLVAKDYEMIQRGATAEACDLMILGLSTGDHSFTAALKKLYAQLTNPNHILINMAVDTSFKSYVVAWELCTIVTADVAAVVGVTGGGDVRSDDGDD
jgi:hypothetical protein